jgi:DNA replication protein DnaC
MARADGSLRNLLARLSRIDVLAIDDWAMAHLSEPERRDFWEICEDRYPVRSTILTSQLPVSRWHERSAIRRWPMASSTAWSTTHAESKCAAIPGLRIAASRTHKLS